MANKQLALEKIIDNAIINSAMDSGINIKRNKFLGTKILNYRGTQSLDITPSLFYVWELSFLNYVFELYIRKRPFDWGVESMSKIRNHDSNSILVSGFTTNCIEGDISSTLSVIAELVCEGRLK